MSITYFDFGAKLEDGREFHVFAHIGGADEVLELDQIKPKAVLSRDEWNTIEEQGQEHWNEARG